MNTLIPLILAIAATAGSLSAQAQVQRYNKERVRAQMLALIEKSPETTLVTVGAGETHQARLFVAYYVNHIAPYEFKLESTYRRAMAYRLLLDSASYNSQTEKEQFEKDQQKAFGALNGFNTDSQITEMYERWARMAQGLSGELPDLARANVDERRLESFDESMRPVLDEYAKLSSVYSRAINDSPFSAALVEYQEKRTEAASLYKNGELSLQEAALRTHEFYQAGGAHRVGYQAVRETGETLNRAAVLRSQLARSKGFPTWAAYKMTENGMGYEPRFRGPQAHRELLTKLLNGLKPLRLKLIADRARELGIENRPDLLREEYLDILNYPSLLQLQPYLAPEHVTTAWENILLESGFSRDQLSQIVVDDSFRQAKFATGAYNMSILNPYVTQKTINLDTLSFEPIPKTSPLWQPGLSYILQTWKAGGWSDLKTAAHEGGHATEKSGKWKLGQSPESYGWVEVPSMTSERFANDPQILYRHVIPVNGQRPSLVQIQEWADGTAKNDVIATSRLANRALFDIDLWDYDYSAPGAQTYLERVEQVSKRVDEMTGMLPNIDSEIPAWYSLLHTGHFVSGNVRYSGYVFAEIGSRLMMEFISDEVEKESGRRDWYRQEGLGEIFNDLIYANGWRGLYPEIVERISGRKFEPEALVNDCARALGEVAQ